MDIVFGMALLFAAGWFVFSALRQVYVLLGYRRGNVAVVTATLTNHSLRRRWYDRRRWFEIPWTGYIYTYRVDGRTYMLKGAIHAAGDRLPSTVQVAFQRSDPSCCFIPTLSAPTQLQNVALYLCAAIVSICFGCRLLCF